MNAPRAYRNEQDLLAMQDLLVQGRKANNGSYYIHPGDLKWWLYYPPLAGDFWKHIHLWDDPNQPAKLLGWALISPDWVAIDVYIRPELRGSASAMEMYIWAEEQATQVAHEHGRKTISSLWIRQDDTVLSDHFYQRGFRLRRGMVHLRRELEADLPVVMPAGGFDVRSCRGEVEVAARARAQYGVFGSTAPFEQYLQRFTNFMRSPAYEPELDIVAVSPQGAVGAFCIVWLDPVNRVGLFEPVGTHTIFQRRGLGRAVMLEGMHRLKAYGMESAIVSTNENNLAGVKLYESVGFQVIHKLGTFEKDV